MFWNLGANPVRYDCIFVYLSCINGFKLAILSLCLSTVNYYLWSFTFGWLKAEFFKCLLSDTEVYSATNISSNSLWFSVNAK